MDGRCPGPGAGGRVHVFSGGFAAALGCVAALAACGSSAPATAKAPTTTTPTVASTTSRDAAGTSSSPTATASNTAGSTTSAASLSVADGSYRLTANPNCGEFVVDGASLSVHGTTATVIEPSFPGAAVSSALRLVTGVIAQQGKTVHIHVADRPRVVIDLTGTVNAAGSLVGNGQSGGVNPSGETGWNCLFTYTATPGTAPAAAGQTLSADSFYSPSRNISCQILTDSVRCQTNTPPKFVTMSASGAFTICTGANCLGNIGEGTPVLAYGDTTLVGLFTCVSATAGVTCTAGGKGFAISRAGVTKVP